jgi:predicted phage terminase large subunit-like protein
MLTEKERKEARERWINHKKRIQSLTSESLTPKETTAQKSARIRRLLNDYDAFCEYYFPHYLNRYDGVTGKLVGVCHNAPFHRAAAKKVRETSNLKGVFLWPRGHAKSTHFDVFIPLWLIFQQPHRLINFMVIVGKSEDSANKLLGDVQAELESNRRIINDFGEQKNLGDWQDGEFVTRDGVAFMALGRGQSPRGLRDKNARPDYIVIDDLDDDEMCLNPRRVRECTAWVKEALFGSLDVGRGRFIMVGNLISKTSVLANMAANKSVYVSKIYAVDKEGYPVWREKWTKEEAQAYAVFVGYRAWQKEMMHNPIIEGCIFRYDWIKYKKLLPLRKYDEIICYIDPSLKPKTTNDYKAARIWGKIGHELHLIDCIVRQCTMAELVRWLYDFNEQLPEDVVIKYFMEANFYQDTLLDDFADEGDRRGYQLPVMPDKRKKPDKLQRIESISPLWERGWVWYNADLKDTPDMQAGIDQTLALEKGSTAHDDAPDADEGAIWMLQRNNRINIVKPRIGQRPVSKYGW